MTHPAPSTPSAFQRRLPFFHRVLTSRRLWKSLGFAALGLITVIALFFAVENWRGARAWKAVRDELRAKGEPLSFAELVPPMPPDDENFAMTPFFRGAFDKTIDPATGKERWRLWQQDQVKREAPVAPTGIATDGQWQLGERTRIKWNNSELKALETALAEGLNTNEPFGVMRQYLALKKSELTEVEIAAQRPQSQFPVHFEDNVSALLPHLGEIRRLGRLFSLRALAQLEAGDAAAALQDVLTTIRLAESLKKEPILISGLVRIAILELAMQPVWQGLADCKWDKSQLRDLQSRLEAIDLLAAYQLSMRGERIFALEFCDLVERERSLENMGEIDVSGNFPSLEERLLNHAPKGWYVNNKAVIARTHQDFSLPAIDPTARRYHPEKTAAYDAELIRMLSQRRKYFLARMILPAVGKTTQKFVLAQTSLDQAVIACALERHRLARGSYPATLTELVPEFLTALPHDIMDGQPLRYRLENGKFTLYSIGVNGTDDGGQAAFKEVRDGRTWLREEGDWVWSYSKAANN